MSLFRLYSRVASVGLKSVFSEGKAIHVICVSDIRCCIEDMTVLC